MAQPARRLRLANAHTWEKLDLVYWADGEYIPEALAEINHLMRDHRANRSKAMDVKANRSALHLGERAGHERAGSRLVGLSHAGNQRQASQSLLWCGQIQPAHGSPGNGSQHPRENQPRNIHKAALAMAAGGVGLYSGSGFVHIDTGRVRSWGQ